MLGLLCGSIALALAGAAISAPAGWEFVVLLSVASGVLLAICGLVFACVGYSAPRRAKLLLTGALLANLLALALLAHVGFQSGSHLVDRLGKIRRSAAGGGDDGVAPARQAIVVPADTPKWADRQTIFDRWAQAKLIEAYETHGNKDERWNEPARELIGRAMRKWIAVEGTMRDRGLEELGNKAVAAGCDDPLVLFFRAAAMPRGTPREEALQTAVQGLAASKYSPALLYLGRVELWQQLNARQDSEQAAAALVPASFGALKLALSEGPMSAEDQEVWQFLLTRRASGDLLEAHGEALCAVVDASPQVADWLKLGLRGAVEVELAWQARGAEYAEKVKPEGWRGFNEYLDSASEHLVKSWELNPKHPAAATNMIRVVMGIGNREAVEMRIWFDRAVAARFDHAPAYQAFLWGLRPRWHGSHEAMLAFGRECLATKRFDTWVPWYCMVAAQDVASEWDDPAAFYAEEAPYAELKAVCEGYLNARSSLRSEKFFRSHLAILAGRCNQPKDCRAYLESLAFQLDPSVGSFWNVDTRSEIRWLSAMSGPAAELLEAAEEAALEEKSALALEKITAALEVPELDAPGRSYLQERKSAFTAQQALARSTPKPLFPSTDLAGWESRGAYASVPQAGVLQFAAARTGVLVSDIAPGNEFELTGEIEFAAPTTNASEAQVMLSRVIGPSQSAWTIIRFLQHEQYGDGVTFQVEDAQRTVKRADLPSRFSFSVVLSGGRVQVQVLGDQMIDAPLNLPASTVAGMRLGLGASASPDEAVVRFHNLQLKIIGSAGENRP